MNRCNGGPTKRFLVTGSPQDFKLFWFFVQRFFEMREASG